MTILKILDYPDPRLKRSAIKVVNFADPTIQATIDDMFETHYATPHCAALAATQLDLEIPWHITVIDFSEKKDQPLCLVNAEIISREGDHAEEEGCMSVYPNLIVEKVTRASTIQVRAQDRTGKLLEFTAEGFLAKCIQHELDHLNGKIFLNYISPFKLRRVHQKIQKKLGIHITSKPLPAADISAQGRHK